MQGYWYVEKDDRLWEAARNVFAVGRTVTIGILQFLTMFISKEHNCILLRISKPIVALSTEDFMMAKNRLQSLLIVKWK